ncbi:MAG: serine hydrolase [Candidatus Helarchaeota archaeon]
MKKQKIIIGIIIGCVIFSIILIPLIISQYIINLQNRNAQILKTDIQRIFNANSVDDLGGIFDQSFTDVVSLDYMFYIVNEITKYYGAFDNVSISSRPNMHGLYTYTLYLEHAWTTGTIALNYVTLLVNSFFIGMMKYYNSYLLSQNWSTIYSEFQNLPGNKSLLIMRDNHTIYQFNTGQKMQVASTFKLYVLEALVNKIKNDPKITWETKIPILDKYKSLPSGILYQKNNGTLLTLRDLANYMINISDNTAADHLIHYLNRSYIENFIPKNYPKPLLTTAESFKLRWLLNDQDLTKYLEMNTTEKYNYLENNISLLNVFDIDLNSVNFTHNIENRSKIEWTFNCTDIYSIQNKTKNYTSTHLNPGLADPNAWSVVSYKGGSDIGVYSMAYSLQAHNGSWFYYTMIINNYEKFELEYGSYVAGQWGYIAICSEILAKLALE